MPAAGFLHRAVIPGVFGPRDEFEGRYLAGVHRQDYAGDKRVLAPEGNDYTEAHLLALTGFQEQFFQPAVIREKP